MQAIADQQLQRPVGQLMRGWREQRGLSQLALASRADISTRHLSFLETGRSAPSREMLLRLAEHLDVPPREQNRLLLAAGFAPAYSDSPMEAKEMTQVRATLRQILSGHDPFPALVVDRCWNIVETNAGFSVFSDGADPALLRQPMNALRLALHPGGMAPRIVNFAEWQSHLLARLQRRVTLTAEPGLTELYRELITYPGTDPAAQLPDTPGDLMVPLRIRHKGDELSLFCTIATFGMPLDITVAELAIETFFPADPATAALLHGEGPVRESR
ncbi:helix-turn-helix domain-containing protein [Kitasatospora mediocidica]|uniref:helix-turn-helix domain-containing protein n=1 Tax=Kitasatospora mediocidica TaxID=58352 RepID=UPI00055D7FD8|nr:helix-turn-helix transcriptional regulator [Kitasatospora mediocidica]